MKSKIYIISGFLGAGKTFLINKLIEESLFNKNIVIIENEFGEIGIDGTILRRNKVEVKEISSGCICCSVVGDFVQAIKEVCDKYSPEIIIIEPSGVAKLSEILSLCKKPDLQEVIQVEEVITVVDAMKFNLYFKNFGEFYRDQINWGKTIVLSRTQNLPKEEVKQIELSMHTLNNKALVFTEPWDNIRAYDILNVVPIKNVNNLNSYGSKFPLYKKINKVSKVFEVRKSQRNHSANEVFQSFSLITEKEYTEEEVAVLLAKLNNDIKYGDVLRAKGILKVKGNEYISFHYVPNEIEIKKIHEGEEGRLTIIGRNINKKNLSKLFIDGE